MVLLFGYLTFAIVAGIIAGSRGRSGFGYFLLSLLLSPLVGIILAVALPNLRPAIERQAELANCRGCPHCAEPIKRAASVCRFCGRDVEPIATRRGDGDRRWLEIGLACAGFVAVAIFFMFWFQPKEAQQEAVPGVRAARQLAAAPPPMPAGSPSNDAPLGAATNPKAQPKDAKPKAPAGPLRITPQ